MTRPDLNILPPASVFEALVQLAYLNDDEFSFLMSQIEGEQAFSSSSERSISIAKRLNATPDAIGYLMSALSYLYNRVNRKSFAELPLKEVIESFVGRIDSALLEGISESLLAERLTKVLGKNEIIERVRKIERVRQGFLPNAKAFSSLLNVRPIFSESRDSFDQLIATFEFRIGTDSIIESESEYVFQVDHKALLELKRVISEAEKKIETLKSSRIGDLILFPAEDKAN